MAALTVHTLNRTIAHVDAEIAAIEAQLAEARNRRAALEQARDSLSTEFPTVEDLARDLFVDGEIVRTGQLVAAMRAKITRYGSMHRVDVARIARKNLSRLSWVRSLGKGRWTKCD